VDRAAYQKHYELDRRHFWRIAKRRLVRGLLDRHLPARRPLKLLDVGGACSVLSGELRAYGAVLVIEPDEEVIAQAAAELPVEVRRGWLPDNLPVDGTYDAVTLLDVLEHVEDDRGSLAALREVLAPGGLFVCAVPALQWLWSEHDEALHHKRRYSRGELGARLREAGFEVLRLSYYTSLLLPLLVAQRTVSERRRRPGPPRYNVQVPHALVNGVFGAVLTVERQLLRVVNMPLGSSLIAVCRRPG
jgi:SAM-dependent methyltransferase